MTLLRIEQHTNSNKRSESRWIPANWINYFTFKEISTRSSNTHGTVSSSELLSLDADSELLDSCTTFRRDLFTFTSFRRQVGQNQSPAGMVCKEHGKLAMYFWQTTAYTSPIQIGISGTDWSWRRTALLSLSQCQRQMQIFKTCQKFPFATINLIGTPLLRCIISNFFIPL